jgi:hypothetical protein
MRKQLQYSFPRTNPGATPVVRLCRSDRTRQYVSANIQPDFMEIPMCAQRNVQYARKWVGGGGGAPNIGISKRNTTH